MRPLQLSLKLNPQTHSFSNFVRNIPNISLSSNFLFFQYSDSDQISSIAQFIHVLSLVGHHLLIDFLNKGSCTYYVITNGGGSLQMITVYHESWVIISIDLTKKSYFSVGKKSFLAGFVKMITFYTGGVQPNDYSIT